MFRQRLLGALRSVTHQVSPSSSVQSGYNALHYQRSPAAKLFSMSVQRISIPTINHSVGINSLYSNHFKILPNFTPPIRTVIKYSAQKGKRKTVKAVLKRFYRLHWGIWIRTIAGRHKRIWKKSYRRRLRVRQHVFCNATQCTMLDKMVTKFWRRPKYYVEDIYEPYHSREEFSITSRKPWRPLEDVS